MVDNLQVAIVGGGIGGLAAALALQRQGIRADVYERSASLRGAGAGLAMHPNGVRMLRELGLAQPLRRAGSRWSDARFQHPDGELVAHWWPPGRTDLEVYTLHRADLHAMLLDALPRDRVHTGRECLGLGQSDEHAWLTFADGTRVSADVVIGADGLNSGLRGLVSPYRPEHSGSVACYGTADADRVAWPVTGLRSWLGPARHFLAFPVRSHRLVAFIGFIAGDQTPPPGVGPLTEAFAGWDPRIGAVLDAATSADWTALRDHAPLPSWNCGRLTLLGDAAHAMLPHVGQGATQALEDAVTLAELLAGAGRADVPDRLADYARLRRPHTRAVQEAARRNGRLYEASGDLADRDRQLARQAADREWMWAHDALAPAREARAAREDRAVRAAEQTDGRTDWPSPANQMIIR